MLLLSITALVLSASATLIDAAGINCYSGTICSVRGVEHNSLELRTKNSANGACASVLYDCRSTNAIHVNALCKTCPGGLLTQFSSPQTAQEMASLKVQAKSFNPSAQLNSCETAFCNAPVVSNFIAQAPTPSNPLVCYSGSSCTRSANSSVSLVGYARAHASCTNAVYDCTNSKNPDCQTCPGGLVTSYMSPASASTMSNIKVVLKEYNGSLSLACDSMDYCNKPTFPSAAAPVPSKPVVPSGTPEKPTGKPVDPSGTSGSSSGSKPANPSGTSGSSSGSKPANPSGASGSSSGSKPANPSDTSGSSSGSNSGGTFDAGINAANGNAAPSTGSSTNAVTSNAVPALMAMLMGTGLIVITFA